MKAMVVRAARQPLVQEERPLPEPARGEVRIRVHACGVCHQFVTDGLWPGLVPPRVPGHEVAGVIEAVGEGVTSLRSGDRVGVGWHGGHDGSCRACLQGKFIHCETKRITGVPSLRTARSRCARSRA